MQTLPSFLQSLFLYALTSPTSMAIRNSVPDSRTSVSNDMPKTDSQSAFAERTQYFNFLMKLLQNAQREELRRQNLRRLKFGSWVKRKTAVPKFKSKHVHFYFPRDSRARLDRMPLAFGKRAESELREREIGDEFVREIRDRLHRMPLAFGKRFLNGLQKDATLTPEATDVVGARPRLHSYDHNSLDGHDGPILKRRGNRLTRMPITFGKRTSTHLMENYLLANSNSGRESRDSADNEKWQEDSFSKEGRTRLSRMPITFEGKKKTAENKGEVVRQNARNHENSLASYKGDSLLIDFAGKLTYRDANQPPLSSLTDVKSDKSHGTDAILKNDAILGGTSPERELDSRTGNAIERISPGYIYPYDAFPEEERTVMNRMPLTFGNRDGPVSDGKLAEQYGQGHQYVEEDETATGQDRRWLYDGQEDGHDRGREKTRHRSPDEMEDGEEWRGVI